ncbi:MAG: NHL repeat-containing protein [Pseudomonadota bacterium]
MRMFKTILLVSTLLCSSIFAAVTTGDNLQILEDSNKPKMDRWSIEGNTTGASVDYISSDKERKKRVVKLKSVGLNTIFVFKGHKGTELGLVGYNVLQWKMKYNQPFIVQVDVTTSAGEKHILYSDLSNNTNNDDTYLHIGLGSKYIDNRWHSVTRNVSADMRSMISNVKLVSVNKISFRGAGLIDDIKAFKDIPPDVVIYKGEDGLSGWSKSSKDVVSKSRGELSTDYDTVMGRVLKFDSGKTKTLFVFNNKMRSTEVLNSNSVLQWKMKMNSPYRFYVQGRSSTGRYKIYYDNSEKSDASHFALGAQTIDNQWRSVTRDITDDVRALYKGASALTIDSIAVYGSGIIGDVRLIVESAVESDILKKWEVYDADPMGALIKAVSDIEKGDVVEFSGDSIKNGYSYYGEEGVLGSDSVGKPFVKWDMNFSEVFDLMLMVEADGVVRYLHYVSLPEKYLKQKDGELYIGIGETKTDGRWHTIIRNLAGDVKLFAANSTYTSCKAFLVRGSGKIGNIEFAKDNSTFAQKATPSTVASTVIGQFDFLHNLKNLWDVQKPKINSLDSPGSVAVDDNGGIYVSDSDNNRILYWNGMPSAYGTDAVLVYDKAGLKQPGGIFIYEDLLLVADTGNNRILFLDLPLLEKSEPCLIIDQDLKEPRSVFYDGKRFFIADTSNNRVLMWNTLPKRAKKPFDVVLGQSSKSGMAVNKGEEVPSYNTMNSPYSVYSDGTSLYIADTGNNRVLIYKEMPTMNGWHANVVIGQDNFKLNDANKGGKVSASSLNKPTSVFVNNGKLFVSDTLNNRVLIYSDINADNIAADGVIGQTAFTSSVVNSPSGIPNPGSLSSPHGLCIDKDIIYIADKNNNRVLVY